mmetsp:Transcript_14278/g.29424  ORF Transcript_14278/g.29424 Transcript_14278/m.29424 type:complete len:260 (+) Transcript_14278:1021-1800(+)
MLLSIRITLFDFSVITRIFHFLLFLLLRFFSFLLLSIHPRNFPAIPTTIRPHHHLHQRQPPHTRTGHLLQTLQRPRHRRTEQQGPAPPPPHPLPPLLPRRHRRRALQQNLRHIPLEPALRAQQPIRLVQHHEPHLPKIRLVQPAPVPIATQLRQPPRSPHHEIGLLGQFQTLPRDVLPPDDQCAGDSPSAAAAAQGEDLLLDLLGEFARGGEDEGEDAVGVEGEEVEEGEGEGGGLAGAGCREGEEVGWARRWRWCVCC